MILYNLSHKTQTMCAKITGQTLLSTLQWIEGTDAVKLETMLSLFDEMEADIKWSDIPFLLPEFQTDGAKIEVLQHLLLYVNHDLQEAETQLAIMFMFFDDEKAKLQALKQIDENLYQTCKCVWKAETATMILTNFWECREEATAIISNHMLVPEYKKLSQVLAMNQRAPVVACN